MYSASFAPQLCGPLADEMPDINSPAENGVGLFKTHVNNKMRDWMKAHAKCDRLGQNVWGHSVGEA